MSTTTTAMIAESAVAGSHPTTSASTEPASEPVVVDEDTATTMEAELPPSSSSAELFPATSSPEADAVITRTARNRLRGTISPGRDFSIRRSRREANSFSITTGFSLDAMPRDKIFKRVLHPWSVHHSVSTSNWIATIGRPAPPDINGVYSGKLRYVQFIFKTEREARKFCKAYAPPKMQTSTDGKCFFTNRTGCLRHCKNCGVCCAEESFTKWGTRMIPKTYLTVEGGKVVRVCRSCDWLSNAFCMSLLQGRYEDTLELFETGNLNLRTCFADIHKEAMFPVHCAVMGGSIELLKWLVDVQQCPISAKTDPKTGRALSVQTSNSRTLLDLAMTGRPKLEILQYLINKGLSINDVKDTSLAPKTLEVLMQSGFGMQGPMPQQLSVVESSIDESVCTIDDACNICFEHPIDCAMNPCGHMFACSGCGSRLEKCPVCKTECTVLRVFKS